MRQTAKRSRLSRRPRRPAGSRLAGAALAVALAAGSAHAHQVEVEVDCPVPESEPVSLPVAAHTVPACALATPGDTDRFQLFTFAGTFMRVMLVAETDGLDPRVELLDPAQLPLEEASCDGGDGGVLGPRCAAVLEILAPADGTYGIVVSDLGGDESGDYTLQVEALPGFVDDLIEVDVFNDFGVLDIPTDVDHQRVVAGPGRRVEIELVSCGAHMDPRVEVWEPGGAKSVDVHCETPAGPPPPIAGLPLECADDPGAPVDLCTAAAVFVAREGGIHRIALSDRGSDGRGRYDFTLRRLPEPAAHALALAALTVVGMLARRSR